MIHKPSVYINGSRYKKCAKRQLSHILWYEKHFCISEKNKNKIIVRPVSVFRVFLILETRFFGYTSEVTQDQFQVGNAD